METFLKIITSLFAGGFIGSYLIMEYNYKQLFAETISKIRIESINTIRNEIAKILACDNNDNKKELIYRVIMYLSINYEKDGNEYHLPLEKELVKMLDGKGDKDKILDYTRIILDYEWKRIKREAKGKDDD